jgi:hypothetical protein
MKKFSLGLIAFVFLTLPVSASAAIGFGSYTSIGDNATFTAPAITGTDTIAFIYAVGDFNGGDNLTGITWDGVAMTKVFSFSGSGNFRAYGLWYILNPLSSGTVVQTGGSYHEAHVTYYTGVSQIDSSNNNTVGNENTSLTSTTAVISSNSWLVGGLIENDTGNVSYTTDVGTIRLNPSGGGLVIVDSNGTVGTGIQSITLTRSSGTAGMHSIIVSIAPSASITGSGTANRLAKFTGATTIGNSLFFEDGPDMTLISGNLFLQSGNLFANFINILANSLGLDTLTAGTLSIGQTTATTIAIGHSGATTSVSGSLAADLIKTTSNCNSTASPAACGSAPAGSVAMATGGDTLQVNTTAVTKDSQIFIQENSSLGSRLGITCNTSTARNYTISTTTTGSSFTIKSSNNPVTNKACLSYFIVN